LRRGSLKGRCKCVYGAITGYEKQTLDEICFFTYYEELKYYCRCKFGFSLEFGEDFKSSLFLPDGSMLIFEARHKGIGQC
jgi:hypothetical protein